MPSGPANRCGYGDCRCPAAQRRLTELTLEFLGTLSSSVGCRATRSRPTALTCSSSARSSRRRELDPLSVTPGDLAAFVSELADGDGERRPVGAGDAAAQDRLPALVLPPPAPRADHRARPDRRAARRRGRASGCRRCSAATRSTRLLAQPQGTSPAALRDRALLETMYACGLRASEAIGLELSELDLEAGSCAPAARAPRSGSCRSAARPSQRCGSTSSAARPRLVGLRDEPRVFVNLRGAGALAPGPVQDRPAPRPRPPGSSTA